MDFSELARIQAEYDAKNWAHAVGFDTVEHSHTHLSKLTGKVATYVEVMQHADRRSDPSKEVLLEEVIPDLLIFALRLVNNENAETGSSLTLEEMFIRRTEVLRQQFAGKPGP